MGDASVRPPPKRLADFEVIRRLGAGGMAEVFLAKKRGAQGTFKLLVLKRILPAYGASRRFRSMFAEEAQLATRLNHPNIVQVYDFQDYGDEGQLLSMEYVEGPDLRKLIRAAQARGQRLPPYVSAYVIAEVAKGLHYAHERKDEAGKPLDIVHRDVSPQNVLLSYDGGVKIADFGIATANLFREEPGVLKGKTAYMSPEQARGERVTRRTDIYSLGVVFYELLTGRALHGLLEGAELLEVVRAGRVEPPSTFVRELPSELEEIVMKALARDPADRFASAREVAGALSRTLLRRQQLVDAQVLETLLAELVQRENTSPGAPLPEAAELQSELESSAASAGGESEGERASPDEKTGPGERRAGLRDRAGREVRHVAVVTLRIHGLAALRSATSVPQARQVLEQLKSTLGEIAFRRGTHCAWSEDAEAETPLARAVVGLMANPARAPLDAVWLAIDVHEVVRGASGDLPLPLSASVGIVRGIATGRRDKAGHLVAHELGETANHLADILSENAPPQVSWVAGGLYRLVRRDFVWGDAPTIRIAAADQRNLPQDMRIYSLLRPHTREEKLLEMSSVTSDLIGRDAELADLHAAYYGAVGSGISTGQVAARVISGEMGIGKTALLTAFLNELPPDARVLRAECSPALSEVPFATVSEWVRELTGTRADQTIEAARGLISEALSELSGGEDGPEIVERMAELVTGRVRGAIDEADVARSRQLVSLGLRRFFARAALEAPLVVALDGLQWSDRPSLELVTEFLKRPEPLPILVLLLARPDDRVSPQIENLVRIELRGLSAEHQLRLLQSRFGVIDGVRQVCADLLPRAGGNPFFLLEMVDALLERGRFEIHERPGGGQELVSVERPGETALPLPSTLEQLIADRLNELPPTEQAVVEWLAVAGGPLDTEELMALEGSDTEDAVMRLCARGLCEQKGQLTDVRHPLTRDVAYRALERRRRVRMHRRLGEHLGRGPLGKGLTAALVARHLARGNARSEAAAFYLEAADAARSSYQTQVAKRCYRRVITLLAEDDPKLIEAYEALEAISRNQGRWQERRQHLRELRRLARVSGKAFWAATALLRTAQFELDAGQLSRALTSVQRGEQMARSSGSSVLEVGARTLMAEIMHELGDMQGALAAVDRALEAANEDKTVRLRAEVLRLRGTLLRRVGRVHEAVECQAEAIAVFRKVGARRPEARAKNSLAYALLVLGRFEDGIALALDAIRIELSIGGRFQIARTLSTVGECYASLGDVPRGLAYLRRAREAHERYGDRDSRADTLLSTAELLLEGGEPLSAETLVGDAGALTAVTGSAYDSVHEKILRALLAQQAGDAGRAVMFAFDARQAAEAQAYVSFHFYAMAIEARARVDMGESHTGILLATTAMGAIETLQGSEYGIPTRALCCEALARAGSPQASEIRSRARAYVSRLTSFIRDPVFRDLFSKRKVVASILSPGAPSHHPEQPPLL